MDQRTMLEAQLSAKSVGLAILFTFFFGGAGLFYVSILGGIIGLIIECVLLLLNFVTAGLGVILLIPWHILCVIVAIIMAKGHNRRLVDRLARDK